MGILGSTVVFDYTVAFDYTTTVVFGYTMSMAPRDNSHLGCGTHHAMIDCMHTITDLTLYLALGPDLYSLLALVGEV